MERPETQHAGPLTPTQSLRALRVLAALAVLVILWQGVTAGELFMGVVGALVFHGGGAIVLHVVTGLTAITAFLHQRAVGGPQWPVVLAGVVFVLTFVQAWFGEGATMWLHVPLALALMLGSAWVLAWSWARR